MYYKYMQTRAQCVNPDNVSTFILAASRPTKFNEQSFGEERF